MTNSSFDPRAKAFAVWLAVTGERIAWGTIVFIIGWCVNAEGFREKFEIGSLRLCKSGIPFLTWMANFQETRRLDVAHLYVLGVVLLSFYVLEEITGMYQDGQTPTNYQRVTWVGGLALVLFDAVCFFIGLRTGSFVGGVAVPFALLFTVVYVAMLVVVANKIARKKRSLQ